MRKRVLHSLSTRDFGLKEGGCQLDEKMARLSYVGTRYPQVSCLNLSLAEPLSTGQDWMSSRAERG